MEGKESPCVYKNPDAPVEARVQDLLSRMTLPEKIGQMTQIERVVTTHPVITDFFIGNIPFEFFWSTNILCSFPSSLFRKFEFAKRYKFSSFVYGFWGYR